MINNGIVYYNFEIVNGLIIKFSDCNNCINICDVV